jgi:hypothetical protein
MLALHGHPISSDTWKAQIALYENGTPFDFVTGDQNTDADFIALEHSPFVRRALKESELLFISTLAPSRTALHKSQA